MKVFLMILGILAVLGVSVICVYFSQYMPSPSKAPDKETRNILLFFVMIVVVIVVVGVLVTV